jgi:hypothetical protein
MVGFISVIVYLPTFEIVGTMDPVALATRPRHSELLPNSAVLIYIYGFVARAYLPKWVEWRTRDPARLPY